MTQRPTSFCDFFITMRRQATGVSRRKKISKKKKQWKHKRKINCHSLHCKVYIQNNCKFDYPSLLTFTAVFVFSFAYVSACMFSRALFNTCIIFPRLQPTLWFWSKFTLKLVHCCFYAFLVIGKLGIKKWIFCKDKFTFVSSFLCFALVSCKSFCPWRSTWPTLFSTSTVFSPCDLRITWSLGKVGPQQVQNRVGLKTSTLFAHSIEQDLKHSQQQTLLPCTLL